MAKLTPQRHADRRGTSLVELAFVLPVFGIFIGGIMELNHAFMVSAVLTNMCQKAGRMGVAETVTTDQVRTKLNNDIKAVLPKANITIYIKDGSVFESGGTPSKYSTLPNIELSTASPRQLFIVRAEIRYSDVSLLPPFFVKNKGGGAKTLSGQAVMRHE